MTERLSKPCTAFEGDRLLASGPLIEVALTLKHASDRGERAPFLGSEAILLLPWMSQHVIEFARAVKNASDRGGPAPILVFDDTTGRVIDFDLRGTKADVVARLSKASAEGAEHAKPRRTSASTASDLPAGESRGRGRPKLGVVGREVTLLPRQWEWLAAQPGGASVALRRLVDEAKRSAGTAPRMRASQEAAYHFMSAMAGNLPGF
jgi:hypothetical protein